MVAPWGNLTLFPLRLHLTKVYQRPSLSKVYKDPCNDKNMNFFGKKTLVLFSHHSIFKQNKGGYEDQRTRDGP
jgi:hypothetical protein